MDKVDELVIDVALSRNGRKDYYAGRNIEAELKAIEEAERKVIKTNEKHMKSHQKLTQSTTALSKAFKMLASYFGVKQLVNYLDEWTNIKSTLDLITNGEKDRLAIQNELYNISQKTHQNMVATVDLYSKLTNNSNSLNLSAEKRLKLTELINKSLAIGGGNPASNKSVLLQFGQALGIGKFQGQDLRSILQNNQAFGRIIAEGLGVDFGSLTKLGQQGKLSSKSVIDAILKQSQRIEEQYNKINPTLKGSFENLNNALRKLVGGFDEATKLTTVLSKSIIFISDNLKLFAYATIPALFLRSKLLRTALVNTGVAMRYMEMRANKASKSFAKNAKTMALSYIRIEAITFILEELFKFFNGEKNIFTKLAGYLMYIEEKLENLFTWIIKKVAKISEWMFGGIFEEKRKSELTRNKVPYMSTPIPNISNASNQNATINQNNYITVNEARQGSRIVEQAIQTPIKQASEALGFTPIPRRT